MEEEFNGKWFVWNKNGHKPRHSHASHDKALAEAKRLACINPGQKFIVQQFHEKVWIGVDDGPNSPPITA